MGAVERWNRTLKDDVKKYPYSTTGMSPFQLVYGRLPSGPISLLKEVGRRKKHPNYSLPVQWKVSGRLNRKGLRKAHEIAAETAEATQNNYASYYNLRSRESNSR
ncbi:retrovirus-related Pol polyprotein from transposon opus [Trichonephila clavipes]|nr:retrovirus-related Pol polyprotein from transposon opus [Trichonephila clavipes]